MATTKQTNKQKRTSFGEDVEKLGPLSTVGGILNVAVAVEHSTVVPPKIRITTKSSDSVSGT